MTMEHSQELRTSIEATTSGEGPLRDRVRTLVLQAVMDNKADPKALRQVLRDSVAGVGDGLANRAGQVGEALNEAMQGLDEAVAKTVYALQMAVEEAWDHGKRFTDSDLRETVDAVKGLEEDLLATLREVGDKAQGSLRQEATSLGAHLRNTGTDTGTRVRAVLETLNNRMGTASAGAPRDAMDTARTSVDRLAELASGILHGLADAIDRKGSQ